MVGFNCLELFGVFLPAGLALKSVFCSCVKCRCCSCLVVFFCSEESVPLHKSVPNCIYPFNTYTTGDVVVFIYYFN